MSKHYNQGVWKPINEDKYRGNVDSIVYRSSWERRFFTWADNAVDVVEWNSEEVVVPYISPVDNRPHRYFVDAWMKMANGKIYLVEIKPLKETEPPKLPKSGRRTKGYMKSIETYAINQAKWKAAKLYSDKRGWEFTILTERVLCR
jgi:hypothetical protein